MGMDLNIGRKEGGACMGKNLYGIAFLAIIVTLVFSPAYVYASEPLFEPLQERLIKDGLNETFVRAVYQSSVVQLEARLMAGNLKRKESTLDYGQFLKTAVVSKGKQYTEQHRDSLEKAYRQFGVPPSVVVAILCVETRLGTWTGKYPAVNVLSTTAMGKDPQVQEKIYASFKEPPSKSEFDQDMVPRLVRRAEWGYRELKAFLEYTSAMKLDPLAIKGSVAGAIGIPQFMPSNISHYGYDGEGDGVIDLYNHADAIASVAYYLHAHHWNLKDPREVILRYNRSSYYADTVLALAKKLE